ncbi:TasA family protein [Sediminibacillus albus]|uniref:LPXTG-motif cell wall anchor domain-containing protein n=1 Tax=Sediminibacillus albus TaxID=407036 RepID=A0A1G9B7L7_9BACI|nr:TasA family protein [Sediminibacillus albus]SDK35541.1 LPXTG-motif cell wall anchor domain-containing protein [Sediminibacillus albus]
MSKKARLAFMIAASLVVFVLIFSSIGYHQSFATANEIDIETLPKDLLFDVHNMKPGDWASRSYTIQNNGSQNMDYYLSAEFKSGSEKLYKALVLQVKEGDQELYTGSLAAFNQLEQRQLKARMEEELTFTVQFPEELGNDYQGLISTFNIIIHAKGVPVTGPQTSDGKGLPNTAAGMFNMLLIGAVLLISGTAAYLYARKTRKDIKLS